MKLRVVVAPDSFKGSLEASEFCTIAEQVIGEQFPGSEVLALPMADGGEGTADALVRGTQGELHELSVTGPMGEPVTASFGVLGDGHTAVIEMAQASGLPLVPAAQRDPMLASSFGTGELMLAALDRGARHFILGLGGSATNDGGLGALQALGLVFLDQTGEPVAPNAAGLADVASVDVSSADARLAEASIVIASDVTNPLLGERGATATYGPQKGADADALLRLEQGLEHFATITRRVMGNDFVDSPGAGAAGGMGFGFLSYVGAQLRSGFEVVAEAYGLEQRLDDGPWDLLITGEGQVDFQSVQGKLVGSIVELCQPRGIPVVVYAGAVDGELSGLYRAGVSSVSSVVDAPMALEQAMQQAPRLLHRRLLDLCQLWRVAAAAR